MTQTGGSDNKSGVNIVVRVKFVIKNVVINTSLIYTCLTLRHGFDSLI